MTRSPWRTKSPREDKSRSRPYLETPSTPSLHSRQSSNASLSTAESSSAQSPQLIFGVPLQQSVAISNTALRVRDARGELKTWGYIPVVVAKCGSALKDYSDFAQNATIMNFRQYVPPKDDAVRELRQRYSRPPKYGKHEKWDRYQPPTKVPALATALLMNYLNDLPAPLVSEERFPEFVVIHEDSKKGESSQTTTARYFQLLCSLPPSNMYLLMYLAETLDYIGRHARVEVSDLAKTFAACVFRPRPPVITPEAAMAILKDLISHRDLDAQLLQLTTRADEQSIDATVRGATRLDYVVSLAQQQIPLPPYPEIQVVISSQDIPDSNTDVEATSPKTAGPSLSAEQSQTPLTPNSEHWASITSVDGVPDLTDRIKKDTSIHKQGGGYCDVYVGYHEGSPPAGSSLVALRLPNLRHNAEASQRRFIREVRLWYSLNHGNINPLLGTFLDNRGIHMVSPWRQRGDVFLLLRTRQVNWTELPKILVGVTSAICYLHGQDCVHGDLKMQNVLLADNGEPFLTDFGLSKGENISIMTSTGGGAFSYPWCAPELLMGDSKSTASDIYAFAMMIIETLTWNQPFPNHQTLGPLILAIMQGERPQENEVDQCRAPLYWKALWELANSCWSQSAAARPNIVHVHEQLAKIVS